MSCIENLTGQKLGKCTAECAGPGIRLRAWSRPGYQSPKSEAAFALFKQLIVCEKPFAQLRALPSREAMLHQRHDDIVGVKSVRSSIRPVQYARHGHVGRAKKQQPHAACSRGLEHRELPTRPRAHWVCAYNGPAPCLSPLRWRFSHRADNGHAKPCRVICEDVSGLCTSPHFHFFFSPYVNK